MNVLAEFKKVTTFIFDIDGVLTDGTLLVLRDGLQARQMHVKDGFGLQIKWEEVLYMGDDLPDMPLMNKVGLSCCPADAVNEVKSIVKYISPINGGWGCVRDVIEKVLKVNDDWQYETDVTSK